MMYVLVGSLRSRAAIAVGVIASACIACGGEGGGAFVSAGEPRDAGMRGKAGASAPDPLAGCDRVQREGDFVVEHEKDFTARFRVGEPYTKTVMLFGGESVETENVFGNAYVFGLDKMDALMLAQKYPDLHNCASPGGDEAEKYIIPYDFVPASCEIYDQIVDALLEYGRNVSRGGDRTSIRFEGAPLELQSVTEDATGEDRTHQVTDQDFHLVTSVEQLTGQSVLAFGQDDE